MEDKESYPFTWKNFGEDLIPFYGIPKFIDRSIKAPKNWRNWIKIALESTSVICYNAGVVYAIGKGLELLLK